jgi:hypothetical protein
MYDVTPVPYTWVACNRYMPACMMSFPCPYIYCHISRTYDVLPVPYACYVDLSRMHVLHFLYLWKSSLTCPACMICWYVPCVWWVACPVCMCYISCIYDSLVLPVPHAWYIDMFHVCDVLHVPYVWCVTLLHVCNVLHVPFMWCVTCTVCVVMHRSSISCCRRTRMNPPVAIICWVLVPITKTSLEITVYHLEWIYPT